MRRPSRNVEDDMSRVFAPLSLFALVAMALSFVAATPAAAQKKFDVVIQVNNMAITRYEIDQRQNFYKAIGQRGNLAKKTENDLIEDRLRMQAARNMGLQLTQEALTQELENFAGRADLDLRQFEQFLRSRGVDLQTASDFVEANVTWREVVRARFAGRGEVTEAEIDRALANSGGRGGLRVLISEIVLPARPRGGEARRAKRLADRISRIRSASAFSAEARRHSFAATRNKGGRLNWMDLNELPAPLRPIILGLKPGEVTEPLEVPNAILLFQLREIEEIKPKRRKTAALEFATINVPESRAADIMNRIDVCDDLYGVAKRLGGKDLERDTLKPSQIDQEVALQLANLDADELTILPGPAGMTRIVMLCGRSFELATGDEGEEARRAQIAEQLRQRRLSSLADGYLQELRAKATIVRP